MKYKEIIFYTIDIINHKLGDWVLKGKLSSNLKVFLVKRINQE